MKVRNLNPGELVYLIDKFPDVGFSTTMALIVAVAYPRTDHMGCEERYSIVVSQGCSLKTVCDCCLLDPNDF